MPVYKALWPPLSQLPTQALAPLFLALFLLHASGSGRLSQIPLVTLPAGVSLIPRVRPTQVDASTSAPHHAASCMSPARPQARPSRHTAPLLIKPCPTSGPLQPGLPLPGFLSPLLLMAGFRARHQSSLQGEFLSVSLVELSLPHTFLFACFMLLTAAFLQTLFVRSELSQALAPSSTSLVVDAWLLNAVIG